MTEKNFKNDNQVIQLNGIYPPLPTPFNEKGKLHVAALNANITALSQFELRGFVLLGSNGEFVLLSHKEKLQVLEAARAAIRPDRLMIAGTGCASTAETVELTKEAAKIGADAALVIPPHYYRKLMTPQILIDHFRQVADRSPIPVLLYNMPACTGLDLEEEIIEVLARHPNIIGLKDSSGNVVKMASLRQKIGPGFQILAGSAGFLLPALNMGAIGGVLALANIAPSHCVGIHQMYLQNRRQEAREIQISMVPVNTAVTSRWGVPALKAAMDILGLYGGPVRMPLQPVSKDIRQQLEAILMKADIK